MSPTKATAPHLRADDGHLHRRRRADHRRSCRSGSSTTRPGAWKLAYTLQAGLEPRRAVHRRRTIPTGNNPQDRPALGAGHRRPAQHHRPGQSRRHRNDLGDHLDGERQRRPGRRSEQAGHDHRQLAATSCPPARPSRRCGRRASAKCCAACRSRRTPDLVVMRTTVRAVRAIVTTTIAVDRSNR